MLKQLLFHRTVIAKCLKSVLMSQKFSQIHSNDHQKTIEYKSVETVSNQENKGISRKLLNRLQQLGVRPYRSIFMDEEVSQQPSQSSSPQKPLTNTHKQQLGLLVPEPPFNPRMTKNDQHQYRQTLCENLYQKQQNKLHCNVRIIEMMGSHSFLIPHTSDNCTIDQYVNSVYKDIYSRYLISRGIGVEWHGRYSYYGVMNPLQTTDPRKGIIGYYTWLLDFLAKYGMYKQESLFLYSYVRQKYVALSAEGVSVETIHKMGHYVTLELVGYGRFSKQFEVLQKKGSSVRVLVCVEDLLKIFDAKALIIEKGNQMIILKKYSSSTGISHAQSQRDKQHEQPHRQPQTITTEYLITSMHIFATHRQFFNKSGYKKHGLFTSSHLIGMQAELPSLKSTVTSPNRLKICEQIDGYHRQAGLYLMDTQSSLADYERSQFYGYAHSGHVLDENGDIDLSQFAPHSSPIRISIFDPLHQTQLKSLLASLHIPFFPLNNIYQQQIYSLKAETVPNTQTRKQQKLHFRIGCSYRVKIPQNNCNELLKVIFGTQSQLMGQQHRRKVDEQQQSLQVHVNKENDTVVSESKVRVERMRLHYPKPRDKRRHKKLIKMLGKQRTEYMGLREALFSVDSLPLQTVYGRDSHIGTEGTHTPPTLQLPVITIPSPSQSHTIPQKYIKPVSLIILNSLETPEGQPPKFNRSKLHQQLSTYFHSPHIVIQWIDISQTILKAYQIFHTLISECESQENTNGFQKSSIVMEPQSNTEDLIPYFFHIICMIYKQFRSRREGDGQVRRGRFVRNNSSNMVHRQSNDQMSPNNQQFALKSLFSLIKLHPTIVETQRHRSVQQLIFGVNKLNTKQQYGYGFEALRLWTMKNDNNLGDRQITQQHINSELQLCSFIRTLYWQILPLLKHEPILSQNTAIPYSQLSYLHKFMSDHINYYISNMQHALYRTQYSKAYELTQQFFREYVYEIFVKTIRKRIIVYPYNEQENRQHRCVLKRIVELLGVLQCIMPYSVYHVSQENLIPWPKVEVEGLEGEGADRVEVMREEKILDYNRMTKLRVELYNRLLLNGFDYSEVVIPEQCVEEFNLTPIDIELFFGIRSVVYNKPTETTKQFALKLTSTHPIGQQLLKLHIHNYSNVCFRCAPEAIRKREKKRQKLGYQVISEQRYLCGKCLAYLNAHVDRLLPL